MAVVMDDKKELINTKSLSVWLHPNFPQHVCTVSQQPGVGWGGGVTIRWGESLEEWINEGALLAEVGNVWRYAAQKFRKKLEGN